MDSWGFLILTRPFLDLRYIYRQYHSIAATSVLPGNAFHVQELLKQIRAPTEFFPGGVNKKNALFMTQIYGEFKFRRSKCSNPHHPLRP